MFRILLISLIYIILLIIISPVIDHIFTGLHPDESYLEIYGEIFSQLLFVVIIWYYFNIFIKFLLSTYFKIKIKSSDEVAIDIISAIIFVGLQNNLVIKLKYITKKHPIRNFVYQLFNN